MDNQPKILAFAGSLRKDSYNKKLVKNAMKGAEQAGAKVTYIDLNDYPLPIYDGDIEANEGLPENALKLKKLLWEHDGFIIASPEYNSSISGVLKNMIDWTTRQATPEEVYLSCFIDKVALIISASPGNLGGLRGLVHLRSILENIQTWVMPSQKAISDAANAFDEQGNLKKEQDRKATEELAKQLVEKTKKLQLASVT
ncbi:NADPH-dependent FMN reductase [Candidatus Protochlamydia amoebophila]|nr:NAD(P)H-dependent oxidoreductase [Candidatus Protochlamydia amoebophila]